jgi:hypothetical protein
MLKVPSLAAVAALVVVAIPGLTACFSAPVSPQDLDPSTYQAISPSDFALLKKDPDASKGRKLILYGTVVQFNAGTGKNSFRAWTSPAPRDYRTNTMLYAHDPSILSQLKEHDAVEVWCVVDGIETYKTKDNHNKALKVWVNIIKDNGPSNPDQRRGN